jgi:hypothetical protein
VDANDSFHGVRFLSAESARVTGLAALPRLHRPPSGFRTLSAVFAHPGLVALFHATSTPRILVFRAFPSSPAVIPLGIRCSLAVSPASRYQELPPDPFCPCRPSRPLPFPDEELPEIQSRTSASWLTSTGPPHPTCAEHRVLTERSARHEGLTRGVHPVHPSPRKVSCDAGRQAWASTSEP